MTKIEIIEETVAFYTEDPSRIALENRRCKYLTSDGRKCAFGRCMTDEALEEYGEFGQIVTILEENLPEGTTLDSLLKPEYQGHDALFWRDLQSLHDTYLLSTDKDDMILFLKNKYS